MRYALTTYKLHALVFFFSFLYVDFRYFQVGGTMRRTTSTVTNDYTIVFCF